MSGLRIEDYALIGDCETAALVGRNGSIDWLCLPRFDSDACFAALLGDKENGRWQIAPIGDVLASSRRYRDGTLILETDFETAGGAVRLIDVMPLRGSATDIVRRVVGLRGEVELCCEIVIRFGYGTIIPWVSRGEDGAVLAIAGPDRIVLRTAVELHGENLKTVGAFSVREGETVDFSLRYGASHLPVPEPLDAERALAETEAYWREWSSRCEEAGEWTESVRRSLLTLKALTYWPTGGVVAAATTSLPEEIGGVRNWDYRFCWLRDATITLMALTNGGYWDEAGAWRDWLLRAAAGSPEQLQIMYGLAGERRLTEFELPWLAGYEGSAPVRVGNAASGQLQLDVYGEVIGGLFAARVHGLDGDEVAWPQQSKLIEHLETLWREPDEGIWEVRGGRRHFTFSKIMAWVAFDRGVKTVETMSLPGPLDRWRAARDAVHEEVCRRGFDGELDSFVQSYDRKSLDASLLLIPIVGFLPIEDPRVQGTIAAIERDLVSDGLVLRYKTDSGEDGLPPGEGVFLACSFWLVEIYVMQGRDAEARALFERLLGLCNDVGLLAEEYDPHRKRLVGNFPQAFSHVALVNSAYYLARGKSSAAARTGERNGSNSADKGAK